MLDGGALDPAAAAVTGFDAKHPPPAKVEGSAALWIGTLGINGSMLVRKSCDDRLARFGAVGRNHNVLLYTVSFFLRRRLAGRLPQDRAKSTTPCSILASLA